jgi:hypothetical protein
MPESIEAATARAVRRRGFFKRVPANPCNISIRRRRTALQKERANIYTRPWTPR